MPRPAKPTVPKPVRVMRDTNDYLLGRLNRNLTFNRVMRRYNRDLWASGSMDGRCKWILPVDVWSGRVQMAGLPRTREEVLAVTAPQWVLFGTTLQLEIRPTDTLTTMRNQYGLWLGVGSDYWA
jgi:hypothetical protein